MENRYNLFEMKFGTQLEIIEIQFTISLIQKK